MKISSRTSWLAALFAVACSSAPDTSSVTQRLDAGAVSQEIEVGLEGDVVALAFSGGGARAAAFSHGVLLGLRDMSVEGGGRMIDHVALVTAVSGGAITAAHYGLNGADGLDGFRAAALDKDWEADLHTSPFWPGNWMRLFDGGLNGRGELAGWLDREIFAGARFGDFRASPRVVINATDLFTGAPFAFSGLYFDAICSDLAAVRVADAVGASMAVPLAFRPTVAATNAGACTAPLPEWVGRAARDHAAPVMVRETARAFEAWRDPARMNYLHLADGGLADNFGLSSLITMRQATQTPYGPFSARDGVRVRRLAFVVVNAEMAPVGDWPLAAKGPSGMEAVTAALDAAINSAKRVAFDAFDALLEEWEVDLETWRCSLSPEEAQALGAGEGWRCDDVDFALDMVSFRDLPDDVASRLGAAPTRVSLPPELIDALIAGGRTAAEASPLLKAMAGQ